MIKMLVKTSKDPVVTFEPDNMTIQAVGTVTAYAIQPNATLSPLFVLNLVRWHSFWNTGLQKTLKGTFLTILSFYRTPASAPGCLSVELGLLEQFPSTSELLKKYNLFLK